MAIHTLDASEVAQVSGGGALTSLFDLLGLDTTNGLFGGGGGSLGLGGLFRGLFTQVPILGPLLIQLEASL